MTQAEGRPSGASERPLVAVLCSVPVVGEAVGAALSFAEVRTFESGAGDVSGLLRWLRPDALVVDSEEEAQQATAYARATSLPVLRICPRKKTLHLYRYGAWEYVGSGETAGPEAVRNAIAGTLFSRQEVRP